MDHNDLTGLLATFGSFSGVALIIWVSMQGKVARIKAEAQARMMTAAPSEKETDSAVLAELKALKQQMAEMHSTSHQFDLSFDDALNRLEGRVGRLETKSATRTTVTAEDTPAVQQNGTGH